MLNELLLGFAKEDPVRAFEIVEELTLYDRRILRRRIAEQWVRDDSEAALKYIDENPERAVSVVNRVLEVLSERDLAGAEEALRRARKLEDGRASMTRNTIVGNLARFAPARALQVAIELGEGGEFPAAIIWLARDREAFNKWLESAPPRAHAIGLLAKLRQ